MIENTYWDGKGRFQKLLVRLEELMPTYGYTPSEPLNAFIAAAHLYYDAFRNGGRNITALYLEAYQRYLKEYMPSFDLAAFLSCDLPRMESAMDALLDKVGGEDVDDFTFPLCALWYNETEKMIAQLPPMRSRSSWREETFGSKADLLEWARDLAAAGFRLYTEQAA